MKGPNDGVVTRHPIEVIGERGYYRARCPSLNLYREHRRKDKEVERLKLAIFAACAEVKSVNAR